MRSPLARIGVIKVRLGAVLVGGVVVTTSVLLVADAIGLPVWFAITLAVAVGLVTIDVLGTGLTAPLRQMAEQAARLADGLPVDAVDDTARDEVGELARAFNRMAREVAHTDRVRRDLVANVSHELRTPLASMSAVVENLVDGVQDPDPATIGLLEQQTGRLRRLVDQLLDLSQLDAGVVELDRAPTSTARLVADALIACGPRAESRVVVDVDPAAASIDVDADRFGQVLVNLVGNALRHSPADEPVVVAARTRQGDLVVVVADAGPGIDDADAERVFERFARSDEGRSAGVGGAGLGLPIARWLVTLHGGTIEVERHVGPGARLRVLLPGAIVDSPATVTAADTMAAAGRAGLGAPASGDTVAPRPAATTPTTPTPTPTTESSAASQSPTTSTSTTTRGARMQGTTPPPPPGTPGATGAPGGPGGPAASGAHGASGAGVATATDLLATPVAGLRTRALVAVVSAAATAALLGEATLDQAPGLGMTVLLGSGGLAVIVGLERRVDSFGRICLGLALGLVAAWSWTDALWVLVPGTLVAVVVAGLGLWGPRRVGDVVRALVVGPLLSIVAPLAFLRGVRIHGHARVRAVAVPTVATVAVLLVFGGLLVDGDAAFGAAVDAVVPDLRLDLGLVTRLVIAGLVALTATTYILVQRAGTVATTPWPRPSRPRHDWLAPLVALDLLLLLAIAVRAGVLFGGAERVAATTGLTYAQYARAGFGSLLLLSALVLGVVAVVARIAAAADRVARDRALGVLILLTCVVLVSAAQRLALYTAEFGLTRLRFSAAVAIGFVGVLLVVTTVAGVSDRVRHRMSRIVIVLVGVTVLSVALLRPDAVIAEQQVERRADGAVDVDLAYVAGLSADAAAAVGELPPGASVGLDVTAWCRDGDDQWLSWNLSRIRADEQDVVSRRCAAPSG